MPSIYNSVYSYIVFYHNFHKFLIGKKKECLENKKLHNWKAEKTVQLDAKFCIKKNK